MNPSEFSAIGIDVGGTKISAGIVSLPAGEVHSRILIPTFARRGGDPILADVRTLAEELATKSRAHGVAISAIDLGLCELVSPAGQVLSANCIAWESAPVAERLADIAPTLIEADVRAAALAEAHFGAGRSFRSFVYVTVGTGISSCLVLEGKPFTGARGATGTMASSPLTATCESCGALSSRTLEQMASGPALLARLKAKAPEVAAESGQDVVGLAAYGEPAAVQIVQSAGEALGVSVGLLVNVLDPEAVIVGGGLGLSGGLYWNSFVASVRKHIWSDIHRELPVLQAATGRDAGILGAALAAWRKFGGQS